MKQDPVFHISVKDLATCTLDQTWVVMLVKEVWHGAKPGSCEGKVQSLLSLCAFVRTTWPFYIWNGTLKLILRKTICLFVICQSVQISRTDVQKPTIDCDSNTLYVQRYMPLVNITVPMASDNTGVQSIVSSFRLGTPIEEDKNITFTAFDYNNNTNSCVVEVRVMGTTSFPFSCLF